MKLHLTAHTDGASRGNPGPAAYGFILYKDNTPLYKHGEYIGESTNNAAEYRGLIGTLQQALELRATSITVFSDSELIVRQINGVYRVKNPGLRPLYQKVKELIERFERFEIVHVDRSLNKEADSLASGAIDRFFSKRGKTGK